MYCDSVYVLGFRALEESIATELPSKVFKFAV